MSEEEMKALVKMKDMLKHENEKLKQVISRAIELTNEIINQGWDYYEKDKIAYKLLDLLERGE